MTKILIKQVNNLPVLIDASGHANYDTYSKDIVCASISSIFLFAVNALDKVDNTCFKYSVNEKKGSFKLEINYDMLIEQEDNYKSFKVILDTMVEILLDLSQNYSKNVNVILN